MSDKLLYWEYMCTPPWHTHPLSSVQHRSSPSFSELLCECTDLRKMASSISWGDSGTPTRNPTSEGVPRKFNPHELENFASNDHEGESLAPLIRGEDSLSWLVALTPGFSEAPPKSEGGPRPIHLVDRGLRVGLGEGLRQESKRVLWGVRASSKRHRGVLEDSTSGCDRFFHSDF